MTLQSKDIYDSIYLNHENYDEKYNFKIEFILRELFYIDKDSTIIDIGCGKGHYLKSLHQSGFINSKGLELSSQCCDLYLQNLPHINANFIDYSQHITNNEYDLALCMDMLEHINKTDIESVIENISRISKFALLGIANHSDIIDNIELHLIQENHEWWKLLLENYFNTVDLIYYSKGYRFFIFRCKK